MRHYMPGCDVAKNHPREIKAIQNYMVEKKQAVIDRCCRVSNKLLETGDIIINNCTLCELMLRETHPNNQIISLYEYVLSDPEFPWADFEGLCLTVQDCWRTRNNRQMQDAIRECLVRMHVQIIETEENYEKTKFDGMWLFGNPRQDCVDTAPVICKDIMENYVEFKNKKLSGNAYISIGDFNSIYIKKPKRHIHFLGNIISFNTIQANRLLPLRYCPLNRMLYQFFGITSPCVFRKDTEGMKYHYFISIRFYLPFYCIIYLIAFMVHYISCHDPVILLTDKLVMLLNRILHHSPGGKSTFVSIGQKAFLS